MIVSSQNQLLVSDNLLPHFVELHTTSLLQRIQMTASFLHGHQDCRRCSLLAPGELSGMLHSTELSAQLHRRSQKGFQLVTQAGFLTNSCLKDGQHHRDSDRITGKIVHLSWLKTPTLPIGDVEMSNRNPRKLLEAHLPIQQRFQHVRTKCSLMLRGQ